MGTLTRGLFSGGGNLYKMAVYGILLGVKTCV